MKNGLSRAEEFEHVFQTLGNTEIQERLFDNMKEVYMLALLMGFSQGYRKPFKKVSKDPIRMNIFDQNDKNIMDIIALLEKNDLSLLIQEETQIEEKFRMIEEYANGGIEFLEKELFKPHPSLEVLLEFIESFAPATEQKKIDVTGIIEGAMDSLN